MPIDHHTPEENKVLIALILAYKEQPTQDRANAVIHELTTGKAMLYLPHDRESGSMVPLMWEGEPILGHMAFTSVDPFEAEASYRDSPEHLQLISVVPILFGFLRLEIKLLLVDPKLPSEIVFCWDHTAPGLFLFEPKDVRTPGKLPKGPTLSTRAERLSRLKTGR